MHCKAIFTLQVNEKMESEYTQKLCLEAHIEVNTQYSTMGYVFIQV